MTRKLHACTFAIALATALALAPQAAFALGDAPESSAMPEGAIVAASPSEDKAQFAGETNPDAQSEAVLGDVADGQPAESFAGNRAGASASQEAAAGQQCSAGQAEPAEALPTEQGRPLDQATGTASPAPSKPEPAGVEAVSEQTVSAEPAPPSNPMRGGNLPVAEKSPSLEGEGISAVTEGAYVIKPAASYGSALSAAGSSGSALKIAGVDGDYDQLFYLQANGDGLFSVFSVSTGLAVEATSGSTRLTTYSGSDAQLFEVRAVEDCFALISKAGHAIASSGTTAQAGSFADDLAHSFKLVEAPLVLPDTQALRSAANPGRSVSISGDSSSAGATGIASAYIGSYGQKMTIARNGDGYELKPLSSGMDLAPSGSGVAQRTSTFSWEVSFAKSGATRGLVFGDAASGTAMQVSGASLAMAPKVLTTAQAFLPALVGLVNDGCYKIMNTTSSNVLDVAEGSWLAGANVQTWTDNASGAQAFNVKHVGSNMYTIENAMTGYYLATTGGNAFQYTYNGYSTELWMPFPSSKGGIAWFNVLTGKALTATGTSAGANASTANASASALQGWTLLATSYASDAVLQRAMRNAAYSSSSTSYQILVDRDACRTIVVQKTGGLWRPIFNWTCSPGAPGTPTVGGTYEVAIRGYSFDGALGGTPYTCYYYTQFWGDYLFHSVPYYQGTWIVQDARLGQKLSHGCVRLATENAKWIYDNIPSGTRVYIYD